MNLREDSTSKRMELPATLTNTERKFVHQLAGQLGLVSKSTGKGEQRRIVVTKRAETSKPTDSVDAIPVLRLGPKGMAALNRYVQKYPPTHAEALESHETGAALLEALQNANGSSSSATLMEQTLRDLTALDISKQARTIHRHTKRIDLDHRQRHHAAMQQRKLASPQYHEMQKNVRAKLPAHCQAQNIVDTVARHQVTIVQGETGSGALTLTIPSIKAAPPFTLTHFFSSSLFMCNAGKSTQVPQFLLDANPTCNIVCTQPRRISAMSIAERVSQEQCCPNDTVGGMIGYQVRLEAKASRDTQLIFLTPGILLRKLSSDRLLSEYTHIIIDE